MVIKMNEVPAVNLTQGPVDMTVIRLGRVRVDFGSAGDPDRIMNIVGDIPGHLRAHASCFEPTATDYPEVYQNREGIAAWPEGIVERRVAVIKPNRHLSGYKSLERFVDELDDFDHLDFPFLTCVPRWEQMLYDNHMAAQIAVSSRNSLYRPYEGHLGVTCYYTDYCFRYLSDWMVGNDWYLYAGVLVGCKE